MAAMFGLSIDFASNAAGGGKRPLNGVVDEIRKRSRLSSHSTVDVPKDAPDPSQAEDGELHAGKIIHAKTSAKELLFTYPYLCVFSPLLCHNRTKIANLRSAQSAYSGLAYMSDSKSVIHYNAVDAAIVEVEAVGGSAAIRGPTKHRRSVLCKKYGPLFVWGQLNAWYKQTVYDPSASLSAERRGTISLPDIECVFLGLRSRYSAKVSSPTLDLLCLRDFFPEGQFVSDFYPAL